jgi:hypothetical protein
LLRNKKAGLLRKEKGRVATQGEGEGVAVRKRLPFFYLYLFKNKEAGC